MGANTYLVGARSYGYKTAASGTAIVQNIDPISGARLSIVAFGVSLTLGPVGQKAYFMKALGQTTVTTAVSAALSTVVLTADPGVGVSNSLAASDVVVVQLSDGTYQWTTVSSFTTATMVCVLASALTAAVSAGAKIWDFGIYSDTGHMPFVMTVSAQTTKDTDGPGIFFGAAIGDPMRVELPNAASQVASIDYLSVLGINA